MIDNIANYLKFKYEFELVPDTKYGSYDPQLKTWDGLIGRLLNRVCTFGVLFSYIFLIYLSYISLIYLSFVGS